MKDTNKIFYLVLFVLALVVNFAGINVKFFTDDQGLYASIAKNLYYRKDFFELFTYNTDWLDKPHFPFWAVLLSFKVFGISVWAYRLPALLCFLISVIYTYLLARKYYSFEVAATAVLMLMTAQHVLLSNTDVRAEPYLMAFITGAIYHIACLQERYNFFHLLLAALLTAFAIMTKGIFVIAAIGGSLIGQLAFQKKLRDVFKVRWLLLVSLTLLFTLPEFYALYVQFDIHPEKTVFGRHHVSGIRWFLWDSQFGRFVNNGPISRKVSGSVFFYLHTLLWAFAPWCLFLYYAIFEKLKIIFSGKRTAEYYSLSGGIILLLLFSLSRFQLPFYTNTVFPLFAIVTASVFHQQLSFWGNRIRASGIWVFIVLLTIAIIALNIFLQPTHQFFFVIGCLLFGAFAIWILSGVKSSTQRILFMGCTAALFAGFYLNTVFYNEITPYKGQIAAAEYLNQKPFNSFPIYSVTAENNIFQFYCKKQVDLLPVEKFGSFKPNVNCVLYVSQASLDYLDQQHIPFRVMRKFINYPQENILPKFLNRKTRGQVLDHVYLIYKSAE